jgi:hypothetical protein
MTNTLFNLTLDQRIKLLKEQLRSEMDRYKWQENPEKVHRLQGNIGALEWCQRVFNGSQESPIGGM